MSGLFSDFEAFQTASSDVDRITSKSPQNSKRNDPPPPFPDTTSPDPPLPLHDRDAPRRDLAVRALEGGSSTTKQILIDQDLRGWKEVEYEV